MENGWTKRIEQLEQENNELKTRIEGLEQENALLLDVIKRHGVEVSR